MNTYQFKTNINCGGCIAAVTPHLEKLTEIVKWNVDTVNPQKVLTVETPLPASEVKSAVEKAGFKAEQL
ncbi:MULTISPECIES: heavy-metal-associated domain-containing protein [Chitinophagaceae]|uniref:heavy-metal-associated domain-containing protein n=1 Tax=Chitinophagaceae TaxID=563835 RepID=UPI000DEEF87D|nr:MULTISPECIES: cation transporter [Chitinophagaceae]RPD51136.1 hypothetical protein DRJ53_00185 [Paracnuella aquatica]